MLGLKSRQPAPKSIINKKTQVDLVTGVNSLTVEEPAGIKSRNLDVLAEYQKSQRKNAANFVVIGMGILV
jgi:elongation factor 1 alpha-like protein